jgi:NADH-quinone oxidoreductase subunit N
MSSQDLLLLAPMLILSGAVVLMLLVIAFNRNHVVIAVITFLGMLGALLALVGVSSLVPRQVTPLISMDGYAIFFAGLILAAGLVVTVLSYGYLEQQDGDQEEYYVLLALATLGSVVIVASSHFASFFLGLQILSLSLYALIAYIRRGLLGLEAGVKYLVLAATSDAFLLFGMALIYADTGTLEFGRIAQATSGGGRGLLLPGAVLLLAGIGFKLAIVPFHMWTPDVYEGAPAPVAAFLATVSKGSVLALLLRYLLKMDIQVYDSVAIILTVLAVASMFVGNLLALMQNKVKRLLAYSSIAHFGYLLVPVVAGGDLAIASISYYLTAYFVTILGAFGVVTVLSTAGSDADLMENYRGLVWRRPWLAAVFTGMLLSLAGIPLTAGFVGKFYVMAAGIGSKLWLLVMCLVVSSLIGLYYYIRVIAAMFAGIPEERRLEAAPRACPLAAGLVLTVMTMLLVWLGLYPAPVVNIIRITATHFL